MNMKENDFFARVPGGNLGSHLLKSDKTSLALDSAPETIRRLTIVGSCTVPFRKLACSPRQRRVDGQSCARAWAKTANLIQPFHNVPARRRGPVDGNKKRIEGAQQETGRGKEAPGGWGAARAKRTLGRGRRDSCRLVETAAPGSTC